MNDTPCPSSRSDDRASQFMRLFLRNQRRLYGFILASIPDEHDADDLLQETNQTMWEKFDSFDEAASGDDGFAAWGMTIARFKVLQFAERRGKQATIFSSDTLAAIGDTVAAMADDADAIHEALNECLRKLPDADRDLVRARYEEDATARTVADRTGLSVPTVYRRLDRTYRTLMQCIKHRMGWERSS